MAKLCFNRKFELVLPEEMLSLLGKSRRRALVTFLDDHVIGIKHLESKVDEDLIVDVAYLLYRKRLPFSEEMRLHMSISPEDTIDISVVGSTMFLRKWEPNKKTDV